MVGSKQTKFLKRWPMLLSFAVSAVSICGKVSGAWWFLADHSIRWNGTRAKHQKGRVEELTTSSQCIRTVALLFSSCQDKGLLFVLMYLHLFGGYAHTAAVNYLLVKKSYFAARTMILLFGPWLMLSCHLGRRHLDHAVAINVPLTMYLLAYSHKICVVRSQYH